MKRYRLILSTKDSSSDAYVKAVIESLFEQFSKEHTANADKINKVVADSAEVCKTTTEKVDTLISDTSAFMENIQTTFNSNTTAANEALKGLGSLFKSEKTKLHEICTGLNTDHETFQASISSHISKLQDELERQSSIKDSLSLKTEEENLLSTKLKASEKQINDLLSERAVMRSYIIDVTGMLSGILETRDSMLTITIRNHLLENVRPVFAMIHRLEGVSAQPFTQKQGGKVCPAGQENKNQKLHLNLLLSLLSSKNLRARKNILVMRPSSIIVTIKNSWMKTSLKRERLMKPKWMSTNESSERLKKKNDLRKRLMPLFKARIFCFPSRP
uniref:Uncharacterized protein n=1 Tax=Lactuca sativa TaxID=4236 RepID=A0A9R1XG97_LACSA|nr:hypothetical protein LSAT_V11C400204640 [Lactuca sativa]